MIEWNEQHLMIRDAVRRFIDEEIVPNLEQLEHGDMPPYDILRKLFQTFGMDEMARSRFAGQMAAARAAQEGGATSERKERKPGGRGDAVAMQLIPIIELCRYCPGMVTAMGVSVGLASAAIMSKGTIEQKERWALDLMTFDKVGAWAITEPGSGSDAFGSMKSTAVDNGDGSLSLADIGGANVTNIDFVWGSSSPSKVAAWTLRERPGVYGRPPSSFDLETLSSHRRRRHSTVDW